MVAPAEGPSLGTPPGRHVNVQGVFCKPAFCDSELGGAGPGERQGGCRGLLHHVAQRPGELEVSLARQWYSLYQQYLAPDGRVGETGGDTDPVAFQRAIRQVPRWPEQTFDSGRTDAADRSPPFGYLHRHLSADRTDLSFEVPQARLASVIGDQACDGGRW